jgi:hypothetical protein
MSDPRDILVDMVIKLASAKVEVDAAEQRVTRDRGTVRAALVTMESRVRRIIEGGEDNSQGYEIAFLDDALAKINEADLRFSESFLQRTAARRREELLEDVVKTLKGESD